MSSCAKTFEVDTRFLSKSIETDILGRQKTQNPFENKQRALELLGGIKDRQEFEERLQDSDLEYLKGQDIFEEFSKYTRVPIKTIENGELQDPIESNREYLEEVLTEPSSPEMMGVMDFLLGLSPITAENNQDSLQDIIDETLDNTVDIGLDLSDHKGKSLEELRPVFQTIADYVEFQDEQSFNNLVTEYDKLNPTKTKNVKVLNTPLDSEHLVYLETNKTEQQLYKDHSLVRIDNNLYIRTAEQSLGEMYDNLYKRKDILPKKNTVIQEENLFNRAAVENILTEGIEIEELTTEEIQEKQEQIDKNSLPNLDIPDLNVKFVTNKTKLSEKVEEEVVSPSGATATREVTNKVIQDRLKQRKKELDEIVKCYGG